MSRLTLKLITILTALSIAAVMHPIPVIHAQQGPGYEVELPDVGIGRPQTPADYVRYIYILGLGLGGLLAFAMIVFAGLEWTLSGANPSLQEDAKDRIRNAIFGLLLLLGAYIILRTINPNLVSLQNPSIRPLPPVPGGPGPGGPRGPGGPPIPNSCNAITASMCSDPQSIASACNARYPRGNHPRTDRLIECVRNNFMRPLGQGGFGRPFGGTIYTYEVSRDICNYTKGRATCGNCAHTVNSCHYGGSPSNPEGNQGALAIDWGLGWLPDSATRAVAANALIQSGIDCGSDLFKYAFCDRGGQRVPCQQADHVHMTVTGCDGI